MIQDIYPHKVFRVDSSDCYASVQGNHIPFGFVGPGYEEKKPYLEDPVSLLILLFI